MEGITPGNEGRKGGEKHPLKTGGAEGRAQARRQACQVLEEEKRERENSVKYTISPPPCS